MGTPAGLLAPAPEVIIAAYDFRERGGWGRPPRLSEPVSSTISFLASALEVNIRNTRTI